MECNDKKQITQLAEKWDAERTKLASVQESAIY